MLEGYIFEGFDKRFKKSRQAGYIVEERQIKYGEIDERLLLGDCVNEA